MSLFSFFKRGTKPAPAPSSPALPTEQPISQNLAQKSAAESVKPVWSATNTEAANGVTSTEPARITWVEKLKTGLKKTSSTIAEVFTGKQIDANLYEHLEEALLMADTGTAATAHLLHAVQERVKEENAESPYQVQGFLITAFANLLRPLERPLQIGEHQPTVIMVTGVNGAGKTTTIGKLTKHLSDAGLSVILAAGDTFRAAAREQLGVWADRNQVEIISQADGDPAAVSFDAVSAGKARRKDVVMIDTAGRLPTQLHLMEEIKKVKRVIAKVDAAAPHEVLLVIDGNTGQNALAQVKAFDETLGLTGLVVTKLDGTAKGGVIAAIAMWAQERNKTAAQPLAIYFIGVGEAIEDLQTFKAMEFAQAMLG